MSTYFDTLRIIPWEPKFEWKKTLEEAADQINKPHEDYPQRVNLTAEHIAGLGEYFRFITPQRASQGVTNPPEITSRLLQTLHSELFGDMRELAGVWRPGSVQISLHHPPAPEKLALLMEQLEMLYEDKEITIEMLQDWYKDFETIHPFRDGNGRVGAVIVGIYSNYLFPEKGYLVPLQ